MGRLSLNSYKSSCQKEYATPNSKNKPVVEEVKESPTSTSWIDLLPHGCEMVELFRIGKPLEDCLYLCSRTVRQQNKICRQTCNLNCYACYDRWIKATNVIIEGKQIDKALSGDTRTLEWLGKARLRQTEPAPESNDITPTTINIMGLNVNQESELDALRKQLKDVQANHVLDVGDSNAK